MPECYRSGLPIWYPVVFAFAAGMIARVEDHPLILNRNGFCVVNGYAVTANMAGLLGSFGHRRILSRDCWRCGGALGGYGEPG
jgi:hypothetical protein